MNYYRDQTRKKSMYTTRCKACKTELFNRSHFLCPRCYQQSRQSTVPPVRKVLQRYPRTSTVTETYCPDGETSFDNQVLHELEHQEVSYPPLHGYPHGQASSSTNSLEPSDHRRMKFRSALPIQSEPLMLNATDGVASDRVYITDSASPWDLKRHHEFEESHAKIQRSDPYVPVEDELSEQILNHFKENETTYEVYLAKMELRSKVYSILNKDFPNCGLYVCGSSMTGLGLKNSDVDMCLMFQEGPVNQKKLAKQILHQIKLLFRKYCELENIHLLANKRNCYPKASVPIIRFKDKQSGFEVDLNINNAVGIRNTQLLKNYSKADHRLKPLVIVVKLWARYHDINDASRATISSYSLVLMVIHYLQYRCVPPVLPSLQKLNPDKFRPDSLVGHLDLEEKIFCPQSDNIQSLGELFLGFLNYYGNEFDFENDCASVRLGTIIPRPDKQEEKSGKKKKGQNTTKYVFIEEPFDRTNTARSTYSKEHFDYIMDVFRESYEHLKDTSDLRSIFM